MIRQGRRPQEEVGPLNPSVVRTIFEYDTALGKDFIALAMNFAWR